MKRLMYIFIPVLSILLMSHNTYAVGRQMTPTTCYHTTAGNSYCQNYPLTTGDTIDVISVAKSNNSDLSGSYFGEKFLWAFTVRAYGNVPAQFSINLGNGYPYQATIEDISQDCNTSNQITYCNVLVIGELRNIDFNIQLAGQITAYGTVYQIDSLYFSSDFSYDNAMYDRVTEIRNYMQNNPSPSAQDIADAVNAPEEQAVDNIDNQSTSDIDAGDSSSATNLLGNIQGIFNQINSIPVGSTCSIAADFGNLNLGNINFCTGKDKLPFPVTFGAYCFELIFVIGTSIILIKQVLSILDWSRR